MIRTPLSRRVRQLINREVARYLDGLGYVIMRKHRVNEHSLNMLEMVLRS